MTQTRPPVASIAEIISLEKKDLPAPLSAETVML